VLGGALVATPLYPMTKLPTFFLMLFIFFNNSNAQKKYYELFAIKYPPCEKKFQLLVEPDTIKILKNSLIGNYSINLKIKIINTSDSLLLLKKPEFDGCSIGPNIMENGLHDFPKEFQNLFLMNKIQ
jgi:hypothetical protein